MEEGPVEAAQEISEGERYLELLGLGHLAGREIVRKDGSRMVIDSFLDVCGDHARDALPALEAAAKLPKGDPIRQEIIGGIQQFVMSHLPPEMPQEA